MTTSATLKGMSVSERRIAKQIAKAQARGDDICAAIMDACGICRCSEHYVKIIKELDKYRRRVVALTRSYDARAQRR